MKTGPKKRSWKEFSLHNGEHSIALRKLSAKASSFRAPSGSALRPYGLVVVDLRRTDSATLERYMGAKGL